MTTKDLIQNLGAASPEVRGQALEALVRQGPPADEGLLAMLESEQLNLRLGAMEVLGLLGEERAVPRLVEALQDPEEQVRWHAAFALEWIGSPCAIGPLGEVLREDRSVRVQEAAAQALGRIGSPALDTLREILVHASHRFRCRLAAQALGTLGDLRAVEPLKAALYAATGKDWGLAFHCAKSLAALGVPPLESGVVQAAQEGSFGALWQLSLQQDPRALPLLLEYLQYGDKDEKAEAAEYLGPLGDPQAIEPLIQALQDEDVDVRGFAAQSLAGLASRHPADDRAAGPLLEALRDEDYITQELAASALGRLRSAKVLTALYELFEQEADPQVRLLAAGALAGQGDGQGFEMAVQGLQDSRWQVRVCAVHALQWMREQGAVDLLIQVLQDENENVKSEAAKALEKAGGRRATEALIAALRDPDLVALVHLALLLKGEPWAIPLVEQVGETNPQPDSHFLQRLLDDLKRKRAIQLVGSR